MVPPTPTCRPLEPLLQHMNPIERWDAAREPFMNFGDATTWLVIGLAALGLAVAGTAGWLIVSHVRHRRHWRDFHERAESAGATTRERRLLAAVARAAGLKAPNGLFGAPEVFDRGVSALLQSDRLAAMPEPLQRETATLLARLREKLGFGSHAARPHHSAVTVGTLPAGRTVSIFREKAGDYFDAVVHASGADKTLTLRPETPVRCEPGEVWQVRHTEEGMLWEFSGSVQKQTDDGVEMMLKGTARCVNRRRFVRTPVSRPAFAAVFPFVAEGRETGRPTFVAAELIEIAGPGLKLLAALPVAAGEKVLVGVQLSEDRLIQGLAMVRRADAAEEGKTAFVAELIALTTSEVAELTRQTNLAVRAAQADAQDAAPAAAAPPPAAPAPAGAGAEEA